MGSIPLSLSPERFMLLPFAEQGILVDLATGTIRRTNSVATFTLQQLLQGETPGAISLATARRFAVAPEHAYADLVALIQDALKFSDPGHTQNPIRFSTSQEGYVLEWQKESVWQLDREGYSLRYLATDVDFARDWQTHLRWAIPHALWLGGLEVLHGSAVRGDAGVIGFCGASGAGKTTLARRLADTGARLVSEDLILLAKYSAVPEVILDGERAIHHWIREQESKITSRAVIPTKELLEALAGESLPLHAIWFLRRTTAHSSRIEWEHLSKITAMERLLENSFGELAERKLWINLVQCCYRLAQTIQMQNALIPEGLTVLQEAVSDYSRTMTE